MPQPLDPFPIYKDGETRKVHAVDFAGWAAQGWSKESLAEDEAIAGAGVAPSPTPELEIPQVPTPDPVQPPKPAKVKGRTSATRPPQPTDPTGV